MTGGPAFNFKPEQDIVLKEFTRKLLASSRAAVLKHRGFPGRLQGTDHQFTIRRADPGGATPLKARERFKHRRAEDRAADASFLAALIAQFGGEPFERGNLDAGRLGWLFGREVVPAEATFDPASYAALLRVDLGVARTAFPQLFDDD